MKDAIGKVNDGDAPLRLVSVRPSCGCTSPEWTKEPVAPGGVSTTTDPRSPLARLSTVGPARPETPSGLTILLYPDASPT